MDGLSTWRRRCRALELAPEYRMNVSPRLLALLLAVSHPSGALAEEPLIPQVQVTGVQSDTDARREFVAGKIIIGRKRIVSATGGIVWQRSADEAVQFPPKFPVLGAGVLSIMSQKYLAILITVMAIAWGKCLCTK